ncbi:MAG TPA: metal-sulfur cluster assembly factor [Burkholderiaceae bacterium]|nr:metal-sulfur cluster assembly factor [Burkholderiaceae bacterium]HRP28371.1 metal-sulfur cluster assembly factor [Burkholderiaceae bacterium]
MSGLPIDDEAVRDALRSVDDPEAGMNIVDLGLIYEIAVEPARVTVEMTMTTQACPMTDMITAQARAAIASVAPPGTEVELRLVWDPPWTPDKMSGMAREFFGWKL